MFASISAEKPREKFEEMKKALYIICYLDSILLLSSSIHCFCFPGLQDPHLLIFPIRLALGLAALDPLLPLWKGTRLALADLIWPAVPSQTLTVGISLCHEHHPPTTVDTPTSRCESPTVIAIQEDTCKEISVENTQPRGPIFFAMWRKQLS
jgi:hypothetical protein